MTEPGTVDWAAALAEVEAEIARLQAFADGIRERMAKTGVAPSPGGPGGGIRPDAFLKMSIPDATKKYLEMTRTKQSTQDIIDALVKGGLPQSKYNTVYSILARRQSQVGDIVNLKGDWGLKDWYPNYRKGGNKGKDAATENDDNSAKQESKKATA